MRLRLFAGLDYALRVLNDRKEESGNWNVEKILWITLFVLICLDVVLAVVLAFICIHKRSVVVTTNKGMSELSATSAITATNSDVSKKELNVDKSVSEISNKNDENKKLSETDKSKSVANDQTHKSSKNIQPKTG